MNAKKSKLAMIGKKANIVAVLLIVLLVVVSISVLVFNPFVEKEVHVDYGEVFSEVRSGVERSYFEALQANMRSGLLEYGGIWYFNAPYELNEARIEQEIRDSIMDALIKVEYQGEEVEVDIIGLENNVEISLVEEGIKVIINGAEAEIKANGEQRTIDLSDDYLIPSDLKQTIRSVNTWLACDAGGLTQLFKEYNEAVDCQFSNCCCGKDTLNESELTRVKDEYGIKRENITDIIRKSLEVLNHLLSGAEFCGDEAEELRTDMTCLLSEERSVIEYGTDYRLEQNNDKLCAYPTIECGLEAIVGTTGILSDWDNPSTDFGVIEGDPIAPNNLLGTDLNHPINQRLTLTPDTERTFLYEVGLERKAAGDITIVCRSPDTTATDYNELRFRLQFKNKYSCDPPDAEPIWGEVDTVPIQCAAGSAAIPTVCEDQGLKAVNCRHPDDIEHDEDCPIKVVCVYEDVPLESFPFYDPVTNTMDCGAYVDMNLTWEYPDRSSKCGNQLCMQCGPQAMCDPSPEGTECGYIGTCVVLKCSGEPGGDAACGASEEYRELRDSRCGSGVCQGTCQEDGSCDYTFANQNTCERTSDGCTMYGQCVNGNCQAQPPAGAGQCCPNAPSSETLSGGYCPSNKPYCCGGVACMSDLSGCQVPT